VSRARPRALVVEADPTVRMQLFRALEDGGFTVVEARDGTAAVASVTLTPPDVVVLDLRLPDLRALDVLGAVRRGGAGRVVLVAGPDEDEDRDVGLSLGAAGAVGKPVCPDELLAAVREALASA
jgi:DNA-binding response OmpR family regulator